MRDELAIEYLESRGYTVVPPPQPGSNVGFSKESGMQAAYESQQEDAKRFEMLIFQLAKAREFFSVNEVWALWRKIGWPEPPKRTFAGPAMRSCVGKGWLEPYGKVASTTGNGNSGLSNIQYRSLLFEEDKP